MFVEDLVAREPGQVGFYLATGLNGAESGLGLDSEGITRPHAIPCCASRGFVDTWLSGNSFCSPASLRFSSPPFRSCWFRGGGIAAAVDARGKRGVRGAFSTAPQPSSDGALWKAGCFGTRPENRPRRIAQDRRSPPRTTRWTCHSRGRHVHATVSALFASSSKSAGLR